MSIASASTTVKFHELPGGNVIHNYQPGSQVDGPIRSISWSKDGNWLGLVPHSGPAEIVSVKDRLKLIHTIQGIEEPSCTAFQNTTKKNIAVGTRSGQVLIYDIKARNVKKRFPRTTSAVTRVEFTAKDEHVVAACENGEACLYSNVTNCLSGTFKIPRSQSISSLRTNPVKRNYVVAGSNEGVVAVWDIHGNKTKFFVGSHKAPVTAVAFSPVNSELIVSTGLDRQFCFYDISANKCIGNIFVENSMTAVDFSPDGKFVVMASQKGKIYVYDTKSIQQPITSFFGHNGSIDHLSFRKSEDYETSFSITSESVKVAESESEAADNDSFGVYMTPYRGKDPSPNTNLVTSNTTADSFAVAMGFDHNNTTGSNKQDSLKKTESAKKFVAYKCTPPTNPAKIFQEKVTAGSKTCITSTPNLFTEEMCQISPVVNLNASDQNKIDIEKIQEFVHDTVRVQMRIATEEIKNDMKFQSTHIVTETRQVCLNMLMSIVKEFIKMENNFNSLRAELVSDLPQSQDSLCEENSALRQRIAALEQELAELKRNQIN